MMIYKVFEILDIDNYIFNSQTYLQYQRYNIDYFNKKIYNSED